MFGFFKKTPLKIHQIWSDKSNPFRVEFAVILDIKGDRVQFIWFPEGESEGSTYDYDIGHFRRAYNQEETEATLKLFKGD
jgi:hypothetical protein